MIDSALKQRSEIRSPLIPPSPLCPPGCCYRQTEKHLLVSSPAVQVQVRVRVRGGRMLEQGVREGLESEWRVRVYR